MSFYKYIYLFVRNYSIAQLYTLTFAILYIIEVKAIGKFFNIMFEEYGFGKFMHHFNTLNVFQLSI